MKWKLIFSAFMIFAVLGLLGLFYVWYISPDRESVKKEFSEKNPAFEVIDLYVGEGNSDFATFHIIYKKPDDSAVYEHVETYQRCAGGEWRIRCETSKDGV